LAACREISLDGLRIALRLGNLIAVSVMILATIIQL